MKRTDAVKQFLRNYSPFGDYWEMQLSWTIFIDILHVQKSITNRQRDTWGNPCTPETFKSFNKKFRG